MNGRARLLAERMVAEADRLRVAVHTLDNGTRVIDAGAAVEGGFEAGLILSEICMGGLGRVVNVTVSMGGENWPGVQVTTDHPATSCMASQYAGWAISTGSAMGSGPLPPTRGSRGTVLKADLREDAEHGVWCWKDGSSRRRKSPTGSRLGAPQAGSSP
jgi:methenyltetrahydromethanopterin cyclohydrolase